MKDIPFHPNIQGRPYLFISYAHRDSDVVFPYLRALHEMGYAIWYDEGIDPGTEWPETIAKNLIGSACVLVFMSPSAAASRNVRNEINLALHEDKPMQIVYLYETALTAGMKLQIGSLQYISAYMLDGMHEVCRRLAESLPVELKGAGAALPQVPANAAAPQAEEESQGPETVQLQGENGEIYICEVVGTVDVDDVHYMVLLPPGKDFDQAMETGEILIMRMDGEDECEMLEDGEEAREVLRQFFEEMDNETADIR